MPNYVLVVNLRGAQTFIKQALKLRDLWAGSKMLSDMMQAIVERLARERDVKVVYPRLLSEFIEEKELKGDLVRDLNSLASVPNKAVFVVINASEERIEELKNLAFGALQSWWNDHVNLSEIADKVKEIRPSLFDAQKTALMPHLFYGEAEIEDKEKYREASQRADELLTLRKNADPPTPYISKYLLSEKQKWWHSETGSGFEAVAVVESGGREEWLDAVAVVKRFYKQDIGGETVNLETLSYKCGDSLDEEGGRIALLVMDGDKMGAWIGMKKEELRETFGEEFKIEQVLPWKLASQEGALVDYMEYHRKLSESLTTFTLLVPIIVEHYEGYLIYAGGDDVMAVFPACKAFDAAIAIRSLYEGKLEKDVEERFGELSISVKKGGFVYWHNKGIGILPTLKMSAGLVYCHHKLPLRLMLEKARVAEREAKNAGRNRLSLWAVQRSGKVLRSVVRWEDAENMRKVVFRIPTRFIYEFSVSDDGEWLSPAVAAVARDPESFRLYAKYVYEKKSKEDMHDKQQKPSWEELLRSIGLPLDTWCQQHVERFKDVLRLARVFVYVAKRTAGR